VATLNPPNVSTQYPVNESAHMYDWLADSRSTHHISNCHELFTFFEPIPNATPLGIKGKIISIKNKGTIKMITQYGTWEHILCLENVSYIPMNKYNIFTLDRWDCLECQYQAKDSNLILYNCQNLPMLKRSKIALYIYMFKMEQLDMLNIFHMKSYIFSCTETKQPWEIWHRQFRHISYDRL